MVEAKQVEAGPLSGITVLDLSRVLAGPTCAAHLAELGATVIKIEGITDIDESRAWEPQRDDYSAAYLSVNRNKLGLALDLKTEVGRDVLRRLVDTADVFVENFRPSTRKKLGLEYEQLAEWNPRLIVCSVSAYGTEGPLADAGGYEAVLQAFTGIMDITGEPDGTPARCGISALDMTTGMLGGYGVLAALLHRERTGRGQLVNLSLQATAIGLLSYHIQGVLLTGEVPRRMGSQHVSQVPYGAFACKDDRWIFLAAGSDRLWGRLHELLGLSLGGDYAVLSARERDREIVNRAVADAVSLHCLTELLARCTEFGVPAAPIQSVSEFVEHPQVTESGAIVDLQHPSLGRLRVPAPAVRFSAFDPPLPVHAPAHGEHTDGILADLGMTPQEVEQLYKAGVIARSI